MNWNLLRIEEKFMMKPSTDDRTTGKLHEIKGTIKETIGGLTKNPGVQAEGRAEKNAGKVQDWAGKVENAVGA
jgi:uncharacterized protein YjbJ (UPF0337 family)